MHLNRIWAIMLHQLYLMRGSVSRVLPLFIWVGLDIVLWGFITKFLNTIASTRFDFIPMFLGPILLWDFFVRVMQGVTMAFFEDVWSRNFLNVFASPLTIYEYVTGLVCTSIATSSIGLVIMILLAAMVFHLSLVAYGILSFLFLGVLFLFGIALGILASAMVLRLGPAAEWFIWPIPAILSPFAAVFYPLATLPFGMRAVSYLLPPAYVFEGLRTLIEGHSISSSVLGIAYGLAGFYVLLACVYFVRVYKHALRSGLIARYSAESVS